MIALDSNLLIYASALEAPQHERAREWFETRLRSSARVGLPWNSLLAFVRIVSDHRIFDRPISVAEAWSRVEGWLSLPNVWTPGPTENHARVLAPLIASVSSPKHVMDAHLAAIAIEHGLLFCSADRDFARYRGLRWENPLDTECA